MSEYWKSNPRKHCDYCKCWIADNKPCIEAHERGKKHKENVAKRLEEIGKKGKADEQVQKKMDSYMRKMEQAALQAYKKDIDENPDMMGSAISKIAEVNNSTIIVKDNRVETPPVKKKEEPKPTRCETKKWKEVKAPDGRSYYWNTKTSETVWTPPSEGYMSLSEQKRQSSRGQKSKKPSVMCGPSPKPEGFIEWEEVPIKNTEVDLELPQTAYTEEVPQFRSTFKKSEASFEEKIVTLENEEGPITFKRKKGSHNQRNLRQRIE